MDFGTRKDEWSHLSVLPAAWKDPHGLLVVCVVVVVVDLGQCVC